MVMSREPKVAIVLRPAQPI